MPGPATRGEDIVKAGTGQRPHINVRLWAWKSPGAPDVPGVGLFQGGSRLQAHITPAQAHELADLLHDLAEEIETGRL